MAEIPRWTLKGDWFDVCKCTIPCPCTFAQPPTTGDCDGVLAWHIRDGRFGDAGLDGLNLVGVSYFKGNIWDGAKAIMGLFVDEQADERQREALNVIFGGQAGGWPALFAEALGDFRGVEYAPIDFDGADDLAYWRAEVPGRVSAAGEALTGPTTLPGQRVQTFNPPGCETGPNGVATWPGNGQQGGRVRPAIRVGRPVEQAHTVRLERSGRSLRFAVTGRPGEGWPPLEIGRPLTRATHRCHCR